MQDDRHVAAIGLGVLIVQLHPGKSWVADHQLYSGLPLLAAANRMSA
jgi:hypothetical protein